MSSSSDVQKLYEQVPTLLEEFGQLGKWTDEIRITDYPCLGGDEVSAKHVFDNISRKLISYGQKDLPRKVLDGAKKLDEFGYEDSTIIAYLNQIEFQMGMTIGYSDYIEEVVSDILRSRDKKEFENRYDSMMKRRIEKRKKELNGV